MPWTLHGRYLESCNCDVACPCLFLSDPTHGECTVLLAWSIAEGSRDGLDLGGLNVALAVHSPGNMATTPWQVALYLDQRATDAQARSLGEIFGGQAGGHPARLAQHIGDLLGVRTAEIDFVGANGDWSVRIGDVGEVEAHALVGQGEGAVTISGHPLAIAPGEVGVVGRSDHLRYADFDQDWTVSGRSAFVSAFRYEG